MYAFVPVIAVHCYPIFFLCPLSDPLHRLFKSNLYSFRWSDSSVSGSVKLQLRGAVTDGGTPSPTRVWVQPSVPILQTTDRLILESLVFSMIDFLKISQIKRCGVSMFSVGRDLTSLIFIIIIIIIIIVICIIVNVVAVVINCFYKISVKKYCQQITNLVYFRIIPKLCERWTLLSVFY